MRERQADLVVIGGELDGCAALAALRMGRKSTSRQVRNTLGRLADFQRLLVEQHGIDLAWPEESRVIPR